MDTEDKAYEHGPVDGLPKSLVEKEGPTVAVIALMQRQGWLNRNRRRQIQTAAKLPVKVSDAVAAHISKTDWTVLTYYLSARHRWGNFWSVVLTEQTGRNGKGSKPYALAVDIQLLDAYASGWSDLKYDEGALVNSCPPWPEIKEKLLKFWKDPKVPMPLGVFMLWPRLLTDLERWSELDRDQRFRVGHAVFALSSIGWTRWFIDEAVARCTDLNAELGSLTSPRQDTSVNDPAPAREVSSEVSEGAGVPQAAEVEEAKVCDLNIVVDSLAQKLAALQSDWQTPPTRALLTRLISLGTEAAEVLALMPEDKVPPREILEARLTKLRERLLEVAANGEMTWLGEDDIEGIAARWWIALEDVKSEEEVEALAEDAERALARIDTAVHEMKAALAEVDRTKAAVAFLDQDLAKPMSAVRRIDLSNRLAKAKEDAIAADRQQTNVMLFVLSSASPFGQAFDPALDYAGEMSARGVAASGDQPSEVQTANDDPAVAVLNGHPQDLPEDEEECAADATSEAPRQSSTGDVSADLKVVDAEPSSTAGIQRDASTSDARLAPSTTSAPATAPDPHPEP
ncbi:MAG TPA: hypothetical protein PK306_16635, partial [Aquabacterium sp.]|nr:hypothetical protein [Aquabacterium sp.]